MNKKGIRFLFLAAVLALTLAVSGCVNSEAEVFGLKTGVTLCPYSDGEDSYGTQIYFCSYKFDKHGIDFIDNLFYNILNAEFDTKRLDDYPKTETTGEGFYAGFAYDIKINRDEWFFKDDEPSRVESKFFTAKVTTEHSNPFADCFKEGTKFNRVYNAFKDTVFNDSDVYSKVFEYPNINLNLIDATVLMNGTYTLTPETKNGGVMYETQMNYHYYYLSAPLAEMADLTIKYHYSAMQSYAWYILAIVLGVIALVLVLLTAKKMSGRVVDAKRKKAVQPTVEFIFDPFDGQGGQGGSSGDGTSGGQSGSGGVFDGF